MIEWSVELKAKLKSLAHIHTQRYINKFMNFLLRSPRSTAMSFSILKHATFNIHIAWMERTSARASKENRELYFSTKY
jgi:hypothetical protein